MVQYLARGGRTFASTTTSAGSRRTRRSRTSSSTHAWPGTDNPCSIAPDGHAPFGDVATWWTTAATIAWGTSRRPSIKVSPRVSLCELVAIGRWHHDQGTIQLGSDVKPTAIDTIQPPSQKWITQPGYVHYLTFNAPTTATPAAQCGRFVFTGLHVASAVVSGADADTKNATFPTGCKTTRDLSAPEKALEFMIFDLTSCLIPDSSVPTPPPVGGNSARPRRQMRVVPRRRLSATPPAPPPVPFRSTSGEKNAGSGTKGNDKQAR